MSIKRTPITIELYSKCIKQESDISEEIAKILNGIYPVNTIDRIKTKVVEKLENFDNSITLLSRSIDNDLQSEKEKELYRKKKENLTISLKNLSKRLDDSISNFKKKHYNSLDKQNYVMFGKNINNLQQENQSWKSVLKLSSEIEANAININSELDNQSFSLNGINNKITNIFTKLTNSHMYTTFMIKRGKGDTRLCIFLGILTIVIIYYCYYYLRPKLRHK